MSVEGSMIGERYKLLQKLGEGGMSMVYRAYDEAGRQNVAVKLMKDKATSGHLEDIIRFRKEIEAVSRLDHPNLAKLYDSGEYEGKPYIVMELLQGRNLSELIQLKKKFALADTLNIIGQIAHTLNYVHRMGVIHRDLKPGNILVTEDSGTYTVKLVDFGVAHIMELWEIRDSARTAGTFGYMSPEAAGILNRNIDERSDLYSAGVIFYQLLTGEPPFKGKDAGSLVHQQAAYIPPVPSFIDPSVPKVIDNIVMKLLMKDPDLRYQSAKGLLFDIERVLAGERVFETGENDQKVKLSYQTSMVGRDAEFNTLKKLYDSACDGKGTACFISGDAGSGKSRLAAEFREYVYRHSGVFFTGRCFSYENKTPYNPFKDIIDDYLRKLEALTADARASQLKRLTDVVGDMGEILTRLHPRFKTVLKGIQPVVLLEEPERERQRFMKVLSDVILSFGNRGKAGVIFLDDLQWSDESSLLLLEEILGKIENSNILLIATYRNNEVNDGHTLTRVIHAASENGYPLNSMALDPFDREVLRKQLSMLIGQKEERLSGLADLIYMSSAGNPFFSINILRELVESKAVVWNEGNWEEDWNKIKSMPVFSSMLDVIIRRTVNLKDDQKALLSKASIIGKEFDIELLYRLMEFEKTKVIDLVDEAISLQLLERSTQKGKLVFAHDRIRDAFCNLLEEEQRRTVHRNIADIMEVQYKDNLESAVYELAYHYVEAKDREKALQYIIPSAEKARLSYANEESIRYYKIANDLLDVGRSEEYSAWIRINESLADLCITIGRNDEAISICEGLIPIFNESLDKARVYKRIGTAYFKKGDWTKCEENLAYGLELLGERIPHKDIEVRVSIIKEFIRHLSHVWMPAVFKHKETDEVKEKDVEILWTYNSLNWMYILTDLNKYACNIIRMLNICESRINRSREMALSVRQYASLYMTIPLFRIAGYSLAKSLELQERVNDRLGIGQCYLYLGYNYSWKGEQDECIRYLQLSKNEYESVGDAWQLGMAFCGLGVAYYYMGDYEKAAGFLARHLEVGERINDFFGVASASVHLASCYIEQGRLEEAEYFVERALKVSKENKIWFKYCTATTYSGYIEMERGNYDKAVASMEGARNQFLANTFLKDYTVFVFPLLAEAYIKKQMQYSEHKKNQFEKRERAKAFALCKEALKQTKHWKNHHCISLRAMAGYYSMVKKNRKAENFYLKSIEDAKRYNRVFEAAKGYYEYGSFLKSIGRNKDAKDSWREAYEIFKKIGAARYVESCRALLELELEYKTPANEMSAMDRFRQERRLDTVMTTATYLSSILELDELLERIIDSAIELIGAERGLLFLYSEEDRKRLELKVLKNIKTEYVNSQAFTASMSIISKVEKTRTALIVSDALTDQDLSRQASVYMNSVRSVICVPVITKGEIAGIIYLDNSILGGLFSDEDLNVLQLLASQGGVSIENARLYQRLKEYSGQLEKSRDEISQLNSELEQRVLERTEELNSRNSELKVLVRQLEEQAKTLEELTIMKERNRFAMDVHDTVGHSLTLIIKLLEASRITRSAKPEDDEKLSEAIRIAREGMDELKRSIKGLAPKELDGNNLVNALKSLMGDFEVSGVNIDFTYEIGKELRNPLYINTLYNTCKEALTNSVRHGKAKNVTIILKVTELSIKLIIIDDGCGCSGIKKGYGLHGMEKRVKHLNGEIAFNSDGESGFIINVEIPLEGVE